MPAQDTDAAVFDFAVELAGMKATHNGVKADLDALDLRLGGLESEMRRGFNALADNINRLTAPKGVPWQMISIFVVVGIALMSWANSYFGQGIAAAQKEAAAVASVQALASGRIDLVNQRGYDMNAVVGGITGDLQAIKETIAANTVKIEHLSARSYDQAVERAKEEGINLTTAKFTQLEIERLRLELDKIQAAGTLKAP